MEYGMDYGTHLVYHILWPCSLPSTCTKGEVIAVLVIIHVCVHVSPQ